MVANLGRQIASRRLRIGYKARTCGGISGGQAPRRMYFSFVFSLVRLSSSFGEHDTSCSPIFDKTNMHRSAVKNVLKNDDFRTFCDTTPPVFIVVVDLFCIYENITFRNDKYSNS